jgi:O-antigen/teichoic acid export membrane protein
MAVFQRIAKNFGAMFTGRLLTVLQQVVLPPIFIHRYSTARFGEWGVLSGAVGALALLNFGVQTYMNQDLAVRYNRGEADDYQIRQSTALRLLSGTVLCAALLSLVVFAIPLDSILRLDIGRRAAQWTAYLLAVQVLLNILFGYFGGIFMGVAMAHRGSHWNNFQALFTALAVLVCVWLRMPFPVLAAVQVVVMLISMAGILIDIRHTAPALFPHIRHWDASAAREILKPSGYFGLLTICTFLAYQAPLIVLQRVLGPVAVAGFIVMRTVFSMCRQLLAMFTQSMGAEITNLFGRRDWRGLSNLYDYSERFIFFLIPVVNTGVLLLSPVLITVWMHKRAELFSPYPYVLCAAISMVASLKEHKYQFQFSTNTHEELARISFGSYVAMILVSIIAVHYVGVVGFLWCWLAAELFQMAFIVRLNIRLFAEVRALEFSYLRNLITICLVSLLISFVLLKRTAASPLLWQLGLSTTAGLLIAALSWHLFGLKEVVKKMSTQLSRKIA